MTRIASAALIVLALASPVLAKDICVFGQDAFTETIVFKGVKKLKPGKTVPLTGLFIVGAGAVPVSGTALMEKSGKIRVGVYAHGVAALGLLAFDLSFIMVTDATFTGTGTVLSLPAGVFTPNHPWVAVPCKAIVVP